MAEALSVGEVASAIGVCTKTVRRLIARGRLPAFRVGRLVKVAVVDVRDYRRKNRVSVRR